MDPNFIINFANMSNINSFSIQVSGNIRLLNGGIFLANQGVLQLTGNLEMIGAPSPDLDKDVFINNDTVFQIGGISNYGAYNDGTMVQPGELPV
ncbi:MAG: hypothetical protein IPH20_12500 [Bacteroidales bacterium]|nr:hypothetical protein [Bacteroidales bacterium]